MFLSRGNDKYGGILWIIIGLLVLGFFILVILGILGLAIFYYNSFVTLREGVANARAQIATQIESRWDALSNLISATNKYEKHEADVLENITEKRASLGRDSSMSDIENNDAQLNDVVGRLIAISESYPELKASEVYKSTMESVEKFENNVRHSWV